MHTVYVILGGFALLALCLLIGRSRRAYARAALIFLPLWLIAAGVNMWVGVVKAGYTVQEEIPMFLIVFGVPAAAALLVWVKCRRRR